MQATAAWAASINFEPLLSAVASTLTSLKDTISVIGDVLSRIYQNIILPLLTWVTQSALPTLINLLGGVINFLSEHEGLLETITTLVIGFVAAWALEKVIGSVLTLAGSVAKLLYNLTATKVMVGILIGLIVQVAAAWDNMSTLEKAIAIMGLAAVAAATLAVTLHAIKGVVGALAVAGAIVGGIAMVTAATSGANSRASANMSRQSLRGMPNLDNLPHLASGAVISPNNEFLAVLGDQKAGTNIEAPLSTIKQAVAEVLAERGGANGNAPIDLYIDGQKFARITGNYNSSETRRRGMNLVTGGAL